MTDPTGMQQLSELWRKQVEEGAAAWARLIAQAPTGPTTVDPMAFWRPMVNTGLEQWARLFATTPISPELSQQWKQFLDQWLEAWSKALGQVMGTEPFAAVMGQSLDQWLAAVAPMKKMVQQAIDSALEASNVASRAQLTAVARQIVELDERLERIEETLAAMRRGSEGRSSPGSARAAAPTDSR